MSEFNTDAIMLKLTWTASARKSFYDMLANFVGDGVPIYDAIEAIGKRWKSQKMAKALVTETLLADLRGKSGRAMRFGEAMAKWAPSMEAMAIDAGEQSGDIAEGLRMANRLTSSTGKIKSTITGELFYPGFLVLILVGFLLAVKSRVLPVFEEILPKEKWPALPSALGSIAGNIEIILMGFFGFIAGVLIAYHISKPRWTGPARDFFDKNIIPWKVNRQVSSAIILTCFAALTKSGVPFSSIIEKLSSNASKWELYHLNGIKAQMRKGVPDGDALACDLFDEEVRWEITIYGKLSGFARALDSLSERVINQCLTRIQGIMTIIRSVVMMSIAGMAVFVYGSFFAITMAAKGNM